MIGQTIAQYTILEKLGEGGMGVVYKARDAKLDRFVALKFLPERLSSSEQDKLRFVQEARAASALNHPNVCIIHDIQEHGGQMFIVMEYVDGSTIRKKFEAGPMSLQDAASYGIQIGEALQEAHAKSIVHRDIKADNIMVNAKNQVKVMDFGLAKLKGSLKLTKTSSTIGTLAYMAPEQVQGGEVDSRSDIFSFGVLLFEMLTGQTPFRGGHEAAMVYSIVNEEPDPLEKYRPELPPILGSVIARSLEKNPDDRYQSIGEIVIELRRALKQSTKVLSGTHRISPEARSAARSSEGVPAASAPSASKSRRGMLVAAGLAAAATIALAAYFLFLRTPEVKAPSLSFQQMKITRLTSSGKAGTGAISPDGKSVVYSQSEGEQQSLWVRQISTGSTVQIRPPDELVYVGLSLSNDGDNVFYTAQMLKYPELTLFQIPSLGGTPRKILSDIRGAVAFSPDGKQMVFNRVAMKSGEFGIVVADADGGNDRVLATHKTEKFYQGDPAWSPDGTTIVAPLGNWEGGYHFELMAINAKDGSERLFSPKRWLYISRVRWLPDGSGVLVLASEFGSTLYQLWQVDLTGAATRLTNDLNSYDGVSLTADGKSVCLTQIDATSNVYLLPQGDMARATQVTHGKDNGGEVISVTPDGRLVYTSSESGNVDIWICDADGGNKRQLTTDPSIDEHPDVAPNGSFILFTSWRTGIPNIWRMDIDGSNLKQLTTGGEDYRPSIAPDGSWFAFDSWDAGPLYSMRAPTNGGTPTRISATTGRVPVVSPDGKMVAHIAGNLLRVLSADKDTLLAAITLPSFTGRQICWTRDGKGISYIRSQGGVSNVWIQPLDGSAPRQATNFTSDFITSHTWSGDGSTLAVTRRSASTDILLMTSER